MESKARQVIEHFHVTVYATDRLGEMKGALWSAFESCKLRTFKACRRLSSAWIRVDNSTHSSTNTTMHGTCSIVPEDFASSISTRVTWSNETSILSSCYKVIIYKDVLTVVFFVEIWANDDCTSLVDKLKCFEDSFPNMTYNIIIEGNIVCGSKRNSNRSKTINHILLEVNIWRGPDTDAPA